jgi:glycine/D-amino acid oxidase-like deaminating enzyme
MQQTDILIIGGGIAGTATTCYLVGRQVILSEQGELAREASGLTLGLSGQLARVTRLISPQHSAWVAWRSSKPCSLNTFRPSFVARIHIAQARGFGPHK